ncbi:MAG TPA: FAD-dependent oxidoreductase [Gordonia polyisoprenivorans]|uniref:NAD(P)/FAD-dependent oxidoreductase n=1 Tax=Gordonia TaxID=2053 RepID=UPI000B99E483|nr:MULTISPECIES: FAD-dependent oxidoreductase [Gordonia]MBE7196032.1 FAD-dependent oxidoreductase [Gordonia polyisoprenivorans]MDF3285493.1 FAD-dependent oxidoreductase [Gordonia sp. N1V]OZC29220.1 FAD-dependent oxidoreductase [Gordonia polyisoprenivorans]HCS58706.1 FAD-dependent oxidoreductase [Gordonia polyisoprenivorans]
MSIDHLVVVGAGLAGIRACESARREGYLGALTLVGAEEHLPYDRPPLSKELLMGPDEPAIPELREREFLVDELGVEVRTGAPAVGLDVESRKLATAAGDIGYDALIIAVGAHARRLPGSDGVGGIHTVRTYADTQSIWRALRSSSRVVVVGAGFIGAEVASAARKLGLSATIVEAAPAPLTRSLGIEGGALCADLHAANGTELILGVGVEGFRTGIVQTGDLQTGDLQTGESRVTGVVLSDGRVLDADLVVVGVGAIPSTQWLADSGVALNDRDGGVECDEYLAALGVDGTPIPGVWAAGDVAHWPNGLFDRRMRLEHWTSAAEQGALAARNALSDGDLTAYQTVPYFWSDWYGVRLQFVGVPHTDELLVQHRADKTGGTVVLYREADTLAGVLTIGRPDLIMKYRRLVSKRASWADGVAFGAAHC